MEFENHTHFTTVLHKYSKKSVLLFVYLYSLYGLADERIFCILSLNLFLGNSLKVEGD